MTRIEGWLFPDGRQWVCGQASGDTLEVAVGTGRNLPHYPDGVRLTGVEFSPPMLELARRRAAELGVEVDLRLGDAHALELPAEAFDTVVCVVSLCAIADDRRALAEMWRVLRPGGRLLLLDHVASDRWWLRLVQAIADLVSVPLHGEHFGRRPSARLPAAGFAIERVERSKLGMMERVMARKPSEPVTAG
ncbi:MAG: class I SAM-dependent methyltransferase [Actinobacteria bacterium]|nr:class I SAM-dependent methyltransferase [Actinomycetota bacterium]MBI3687819.1 class I SAM-dependent methyltransferase [Actinomycetota bacterium]